MPKQAASGSGKGVGLKEDSRIAVRNRGDIDVAVVWQGWLPFGRAGCRLAGLAAVWQG